MVIGPLQGEVAKHRCEALRAPAGIVGRRPAATRLLGRGVVGGIGVQAPLDEAGGQLQRAPADRDFDRFEIEPRAGSRRYERFDFLGNFGRQARLEPPFWAASGEAAGGVRTWALAHASQTAQ